MKLSDLKENVVKKTFASFSYLALIIASTVCLMCCSQQANATGDNVVSFDGDRCVRVNGEAFFPVGIYNAFSSDPSTSGPEYARLAHFC